MSDKVTAHATETGDSAFAVRIRTGSHVLIGDEPEAMGGLNLGPAPYQLLASALAECTTMTVRWYARQKSWPVDHVETVVTHEKGAVEGRAGESDIFAKIVAITGDLSIEQHGKLIEIAARCPVHRTLEASAVISTRSAEQAADERHATSI